MEHKKAVLPKKPDGLLSLLYWVKNDERYNEAFHQGMIVTMRDLFGIQPDSPVAKAMVQISEVHAHPDRVRPLLEALLEDHLVDELMKQGRDFW